MDLKLTCATSVVRRVMPVGGQVDLCHTPPTDDAIQGGCHVECVVLQQDGVKVVVALRAVQRPGEVVERCIQQDEAEASADVEGACQLVVVQEEVGERAVDFGRTQIRWHSACMGWGIESTNLRGEIAGRELDEQEQVHGLNKLSTPAGQNSATCTSAACTSATPPYPHPPLN